MCNGYTTDYKVIIDVRSTEWYNDVLKGYKTNVWAFNGGYEGYAWVINTAYKDHIKQEYKGYEENTEWPKTSQNWVESWDIWLSGYTATLSVSHKERKERGFYTPAVELLFLSRER